MKLEVTKFQDAVNDVLPKTSTLKNFSHQRMQATKSSNVVKFGKPYKNPELVIFFARTIYLLTQEKTVQKRRNCLRADPKIRFFSTFRTLNRTVLLTGLHCPAVMISPSLASKHGLTCTDTFACLFSNRLYFFM